jgi:hypothetical protein
MDISSFRPMLNFSDYTTTTTPRFMGLIVNSFIPNRVEFPVPLPQRQFLTPTYLATFRTLFDIFRTMFYSI